MMNMRDKFNDRRRRGNGFTLVELMVTVSILVILMAVGVPEMRSFLVKRQVQADYETLSMAIQLAKTEALKRSGPVSICPLGAARTTCLGTNTQDWSNGWMVFIDEPESGAGTATFNSARDTTIRIEQGTRSGSIRFGQSRDKLTFQGNGLLTNDAGTFSIRPSGSSDTSKCKGFTLNRQGRIRADACDPLSTGSGGTT